MAQRQVEYSAPRLPRTPRDAFRAYCLHSYSTLRNPYSDAVEIPDPGDLEAAVELFQSVVEAEPSAKQFRGLETQFYSALDAYLNTPRTDVGTLCVAVDRLAGLIEPLLKKVAYHFFPERTLSKPTPRGSTRVQLWKTGNYADVLEAMGLVTVSELHKDQESFWKRQPVRSAILRRGFSARQTGTHESRIHSLEELERVAYSVIGQYLVVSLSLLRDVSVTRQVRQLTEKARVAYLLRERSRAYPLTGVLLSRREHLLLYRHRELIRPDRSERRFLFLNYLAGRGPCFYWVPDGSEDSLEWARQFLGLADQREVNRSAARYLIEHSQQVALSRLLDLFSEYSDKVELAAYVAAIVPAPTRVEWLSLMRDRREEVSLAAKELAPRVSLAFGEDVKAMARSSSETQHSALRLIIPRVARATRRRLYRTLPAVRDLATRVFFAYSLGEVGEAPDEALLRGLLTKKRLAQEVRMACSYALTRICCRTRRVAQVEALLRARSATTRFAALDALSREGLGPRLTRLLKQIGRGRESARKASAAALRVATSEDRAALRDTLSRVRLGNETRDLLLALCKVGNASDCRFILRLVRGARYDVRLYNHVRVASAVASICGAGLKRELKEALRLPSFWAYISGGNARDPGKAFVNVPENGPLAKRLTAACFVKIAEAADLALLKRLLTHNYDWVAGKAAEKVGHLATSGDLGELTERLLATRDLEDPERVPPMLDALCRIDRRTSNAVRTPA